MSAKLGDNVMVPIILGFDGDPVGHLIIKRDALPPLPNFTFGIAYRGLHIASDGTIDRYELVAVSPVSDDNFSAYLERTKG